MGQRPAARPERSVVRQWAHPLLRRKMPATMSRSVSAFTSAIAIAALVAAAWLVLSSRPPNATADARPSVSRPGSGAGLLDPPPARLPLAPKRGDHSAPKPASPEPPPRRQCVIAAIGDSLTDPHSHGGRYLETIAQRCPKSRIDNFGKGAAMVNLMRKRFASRVLAADDGHGRSPYTHVVIFGGVNDLYSDLTAGRTPPKIARDLLWMYMRAHERGIQVVAITVAPWGGFHKYYNERRGGYTRTLNSWIMDQLGAGTVDHVVDAYGLLSCGRPEVLCPEYAKPFKDGIHFGPAGHDRLGQALYEEAFTQCL